MKDPTTGRRIARPNPHSEWITQDMPELRIIDAEMWTTVQDRRANIGTPHLQHRRRPRRILSGLLRCGECGGNYIVQTRDYIGCSNHANKRTCSNNRKVTMTQIELRVVRALQQYLLEPDVVEVAVEAYRQERQRLTSKHGKLRKSIERQLAEVKRKIAKLIESIEIADDPAMLVPRLNALGGEQRSLEHKLAAQEKNRATIALHPDAAKRYRSKVAEIHTALKKGDAAARDAISLVRELITNIAITPNPDSQEPDIQITGNLAALMSREHDTNDAETPGTDMTASMVAGVRNQRSPTAEHSISVPSILRIELVRAAKN